MLEAPTTCSQIHQAFADFLTVTQCLQAAAKHNISAVILAVSILQQTGFLVTPLACSTLRGAT